MLWKSKGLGLVEHRFSTVIHWPATGCDKVKSTVSCVLIRVDYPVLINRVQCFVIYYRPVYSLVRHSRYY
jgi:hypothetical protein